MGWEERGGDFRRESHCSEWEKSAVNSLETEGFFTAACVSCRE